MSLIASSGGVNRIPKSWYGAAGGVSRKLQSIYGAAGGVSRKLFSGAITWQGTCEWSLSFYPNFANDETYQEATFTKPIYINTISAKLTVGVNGSANAQVFIKILCADGTSLKEWYSGDFDINKVVTSIQVGTSWGTYTANSLIIFSSSLMMIHSRDYGDFHLNSSGTSDQ
jgi:hypothetical protein